MHSKLSSGIHTYTHRNTERKKNEKAFSQTHSFKSRHSGGRGQKTRSSMSVLATQRVQASLGGISPCPKRQKDLPSCHAATFTTHRFARDPNSLAWRLRSAIPLPLLTTPSSFPSATITLAQHSGVSAMPRARHLATKPGNKHCSQRSKENKFSWSHNI